MARSGDEGFEQRLDRWVEAGRQFVDGVSGARPGSRSASRGSQRRAGSSRLSPGELGRWVENKLEWLLDDEGDDDWREPWQQQRPAVPPTNRSPRRRLEAVSRRGVSQASASRREPDTLGDREWPSDDELRINRWQRDPRSASSAGDTAAEPAADAVGSPTRPLPRSTRRR